MWLTNISVSHIIGVPKYHRLVELNEYPDGHFTRSQLQCEITEAMDYPRIKDITPLLFGIMLVKADICPPTSGILN
jgi:hypothetical protein